MFGLHETYLNKTKHKTTAQGNEAHPDSPFPSFLQCPAGPDRAKEDARWNRLCPSSRASVPDRSQAAPWQGTAAVSGVEPIPFTPQSTAGTLSSGEPQLMGGRPAGQEGSLCLIPVFIETALEIPFFGFAGYLARKQLPRTQAASPGH